MALAQLDEATYLKQVREHYENLPYPPRDPAKELEALQFTQGCGLDRINYYHYSGRRDFSKPFDVLVAGCGTGDAVVTLATQLHGSQARITALDMSTASLAVAKARVEARGLDNVRFVHDSLLNVAAHAEKPFDFINCVGVLHHLEVPEAGLAALAKVLKPDGVMHLMLYALYGRESVYQMQALMKIINGNEPNMQRKLDNCRKVLADLPAYHGFLRFMETVQDVKLFGDSGLYDLLLHSHDVAYTVPQVYDFLATAGLVPTHWLNSKHPKGNDALSLEWYIRDPELLAQVMQLPLRERQAAAELMDGSISRHEFYAARDVPELPRIDDLDMVPQFDVLQARDFHKQVAEELEKRQVGSMLQVPFGVAMLSVPISLHAALLMRYMDGVSTLRQIFDKVRAAQPGSTAANDGQLSREFLALYDCFHRYDIMFLRHRSVPGYRTTQEAGAVRG